MIAFLAPLLLRVGIPARLHKVALIGVAVVALIAGFSLWLALHDASVRKADRAAGTAKAVTTARAADERAHEAAQATTDTIEKGTERAKAAAAESDDPLAAGLGSLRDAKSGNRPPAK